MTTRVALSIPCLIIAVVSIPMVLRRVPPNPLYGFRTKLTLSNPDIWYRANAFSGWALMVAAAVSLALLWLVPEAVLALPWIALATFLGPLLASVVASFVYLRRFS